MADAVTVLPGHDGDVYAICLFKDFILTGGHDKIIRIWDCNDHKLINKINAHDHMIRCICIGEDQGLFYIISGSWDATLKFFDFVNFSHVYTMDQHNSRIRCAVTISNRSELDIGSVCISGADDGSIICTSIKHKNVLYKIKHHTRFVLCLDYLLNLEPLFVSGSADMNLIFQTIKKGEIHKIIYVGKSISSVLFVPYKNDNRKFGHDILCCGTSDSYIIVLNVETSEKIYMLHGNSNMACVCLHSSLITVRDRIDIFIYTIFKDGTLSCWNLDNGLSSFTEYYLNDQFLGTNLLSIVQEKIGPRHIEYQLNAIVNCSKLSGSGNYFACGTNGLMFSVKYNFSNKINSIIAIGIVDDNKSLDNFKKGAEIIVVPSLLKKPFYKHENSKIDMVNKVRNTVTSTSNPKAVLNVTPSSSLSLSKNKRIGSHVKIPAIPPNIVLAQDNDKTLLQNSLLSQVKKELDQNTIVTHNQSHLRNTVMPSRSNKFLLNGNFSIDHSNLNTTRGKSKSMNLFEKSRGGIIDINELQVANTFGTNNMNNKK